MSSFLLLQRIFIFAAVKWDLREVAAALIYRDYSLAHQGLSRLPQTPHPLRARSCSGRQPGTTKKKSSCMLQALVDKSSCFSLSCYPRQLPKPLHIEEQNIYCIHTLAEIWTVGKKVSYIVTSIGKSTLHVHLYIVLANLLSVQR